MICIKKRIVWLFTIILILTGCTETNGIDKYISFSITRAKSDGNSLISEVYYAGLNDKEVTLAGEVESRAQFTTNIYDKKRDTIYYADKAKDRHADEVFAFDCKTKESVQLTDHFYAINYLFLKEKELVIVAIPKKERVLGLYTMDLETQEVTNHSLDSDFLTWAVSYDPTDDTLFIGGYSESEHRYRMENQHIEKFVPCHNTFYLVDKDYNWKELWKSSDVGLSFAASKLGNDLYYSLSDKPTEGNRYTHYQTELEFEVIEEGTDFPFNTANPIYKENGILYYIEGGTSQAYATYNEKTEERIRIHCTGLRSTNYGNARIVFQRH